MNLLEKILWRPFLRVKRIRRKLRSIRLGRRLNIITNNIENRPNNSVTVFVVVHNEIDRIPYFLKYYRDMGIGHFIFIDNNSEDGTKDYLQQFDDVTLYFTKDSYKKSHFGMDWMNALLSRHATDQWALVVDIDEFFVFPHCDKRPIQALTDYLDQSKIGFFAAQLIDLYPTKKLKNARFTSEMSPFDVLTHFDVGNYTFKENPVYKNLWIQGGMRMRMFFEKTPQNAPALNKTPLIKWQRRYVYISSTHQLLPIRLNKSHQNNGVEKICGALLHTKFLPDIRNKVNNPYLISQHYEKAREYHSYNKARLDDLNFVDGVSTRYRDWKQLDQLGIISLGGWA